MKISVCIPIYNGGWCIEDALDSLCLQTRIPDEVIIQDDASTDNGPELIKKYESILPIIFSINKTNLGMIGNWNECLKNASGDIITFLHQDDGYYPEFLYEAESDFKSNDLNFGLWVCEQGMKEDLRVVNKNNNTASAKNSKELIDNIFTWKDIPAPTVVAFRKNTLEDVGVYDLEYKYVAEPDLYFRIMLKGYSMIKSSKLLVWRTVSDTRATAIHSHSELYYKEWIYFIDKFYNFVCSETLNNALSRFYKNSAASISINLSKLKFREAIRINNATCGTLKLLVKKIKAQNSNCFIFYKNIVFGTIKQVFIRVAYKVRSLIM